MAKIILTENGVVLQEVPLSKERVTIGRRPHNDIVIEGPAISGEHAVIITSSNDSILEDLNSTNGTQINGQPVKRHFLQDDDVIELAQYKLKYVSGTQNGAGAETRAIQRNGRGESELQSSGEPTAVITILDGPNAGKLVTLTKALTTIGRPGAQVAVIARVANAFSVTHVEGETYPQLNGKVIGSGAHQLAHNDVIDLSGTRMKFLMD